jgi:site-specific DNA recombinase
MNKALIYCRVSTDEQAGDERHSLKTQLRLCERAIEEMKIYKFADDGLYKDPGKSATNMNRPGLQDMLIRIQEDKSIGAVYVQDTDRLARNASDHLTIKALMKKHGVELISVSQPGIEDTPEGNFMDLIIAGVNQLQSQITSRKTLKSMEQKYKDGWWPTKAPMGYFNSGTPDDEKKRIITTDPVRAPLIAEGFKLYSTGDYSLIEIRDLLYKKGLVSTVGKRVAMSKMFRTIKCPFYYGAMEWRNMNDIGKHEAIINKDLFDKCQKIMQENNRYACRRHKHNFLLRGFVFCNKCGQRYTAEYHPLKKKAYYHCNRSNDQKKCTDKYVEVFELENQIIEKFKGLQFSDDFIDKVVAKMRSIYEEKKSDVGNQKKHFMTSKVNFERKLEIAEEKLINGIIDDAAFTKIKVRYREQIEGIEDEIHKVDQTKNLKIDVIQDVLALMRNIGKTYEKAPTDLKRLYLGLFWDQFKAEDKLIVEATKSPIVRGLETTGALVWNTKQKPDQMNDRAFAEDKITTGSSVIISPERGRGRNKSITHNAANKEVITTPTLGGYWESNPDRRFHKPQC